MRAFLFLTLLLGADAGVTAKISGVVQRRDVTMPCLGGARVTPEMIKSQVTPLERQPLTFIAGRSPFGKAVARTTSDEKAHFSVELPPGTWCVVFGDGPKTPPRTKAGPKGAPSLTGGCDARAADPQLECDAVFSMPTADAAAERTIEHVSTNQCPQAWAQPCFRGAAPP